MTITYYDSQLMLGPARMKELLNPEEWIFGDDSDLEKCFDTLCERSNIFICNNLGIRNFHHYLEKRFKYVKAAGGRVVSPAGNSLLIRREGCWDLPKGMVEPGESLAAAAVREVKEETGIPRVAVDRLLTKTYHIYDKYGGWHLKQTSWFAMHTDQEHPLTPQTEEGISEARWIDEETSNHLLQNSFASLRQLTRFPIRPTEI